MLPTLTTEQLPAELTALDTPTLRRELAQALELSAQHLLRLAAIWAELERRGEDLRELRTGLAVYLPQIAAGTVDAELVVRFAGQRTILNRVAALSITEQRRLLEGATLPVVERLSTGLQVRDVPLRLLTNAQARVALDDGRIRGEAEQRALLLGAHTKAPRRRHVKPEDIPGALDLIERLHPEAVTLIEQLRVAIGIAD